MTGIFTSLDVKLLLPEHTAPRGPQGMPCLGSPEEGEQDPPCSHFETPFHSSALYFCHAPCQTVEGVASLQSHWNPCVKEEVREGHVEINLLTICPFPAKRLR